MTASTAVKKHTLTKTVSPVISVEPKNPTEVTTLFLNNLGYKRRLTITVPVAKEKEFADHLKGKTILEALEGMAILDWPVSTFSYPGNFHKSMATLLFDYAGKSLRWLLENALINTLEYLLIVDFTKTHSPVIFHVYDRLTSSGYDSKKVYVRGDFDIVFIRNAYQSTTNRNKVTIQSELVEMFTRVDNELFAASGDWRYSGYGPIKIFQDLEPSDKYTKEEIAKFIKRRNVTLGKGLLNTVTRYDAPVKTWWQDREDLGFNKPEVAVMKHEMHEGAFLIYIA